VKLVLIYGAPGVGKLTTAQAIFDFPSPQFLELAGTIRLAAFEAAARATPSSSRWSRWWSATRATFCSCGGRVTRRPTRGAEAAARRIAEYFALPIVGGQARGGSDS